MKSNTARGEKVRVSEIGLWKEWPLEAETVHSSGQSKNLKVNGADETIASRLPKNTERLGVESKCPEAASESTQKDETSLDDRILGRFPAGTRGKFIDSNSESTVSDLTLADFEYIDGDRRPIQLG